MIYVYELRNSTEVVEYVGVSKNPNNRLYDHTISKPSLTSGHGKFYGRTDLTVHSVSQWPTRKIAMKEEKRVKISYGMVWGEGLGGTASCKNMRVLTKDIAEEIRSKYIPKIYHMRMLAEEYNVSKTTVQRILENLTYMNE
tara:strand:- start:40 stop:462 length:423 start_codon:yes stop_codon:yes gene_type:complete